MRMKKLGVATNHEADGSSRPRLPTLWRVRCACERCVREVCEGGSACDIMDELAAESCGFPLDVWKQYMFRFFEKKCVSRPQIQNFRHDTSESPRRLQLTPPPISSVFHCFFNFIFKGSGGPPALRGAPRARIIDN